MKKYLPLFVLALSGFCFGQSADKAVPTYSVNDKLIGLANLYDGLQDCSIKSVAGKVTDISSKKGTAVRVTVKIDKKNTADVIIPLDRVADVDRRAIFRHLITKKNVIRASGYACGGEEVFTAFSIDRVY